MKSSMQYNAGPMVSPCNTLLEPVDIALLSGSIWKKTSADLLPKRLVPNVVGAGTPMATFTSTAARLAVLIVLEKSARISRCFTS